MSWISILEFYILSTSFGGTLLVCLWCIFNNIFRKVLSVNGTYIIFRAIIFFYFIPIVYFERFYDMLSDEELISSVPIIGLINPHMSNILFYPFIIWLTGAILTFAYNIYSHMFFYFKVLRYSALAIDPFISRTQQNISMNLKIKKPLPVYYNDNIATPMLAGILFPKILIPNGFPSEDLSVMLYHENIHYKQHDLLFKQLGAVIRCLHWFNPFTYMLTNLINTWCEFNCDNVCCRQNTFFTPKEYARTLLELATTPRMSLNLYYSAFSEKTSHLESRVKQIATRRTGVKYAGILIIIVSVTFFIFGTLTVNAASNKVLTYYYDWYYNTSTYIKEEPVYIPKTPEITQTHEEVVADGTIIIEDAPNDDISDVMTVYYWKIKKNNGINCMKVACKKGQTLSVANTMLKRDLTLHHGIIDLEGNIHYVDGENFVVFEYKIPEDGEYTLFIQNPTDKDVNINGVYSFQ